MAVLMFGRPASPAPTVAQAFGYNALALDWTPASDLSDIDTTHQSTTAPSSLNFMWTTCDPGAHTAYIDQGISYDSGKSALKLTSASDYTNATGISMAWVNTINGDTRFIGRVFDMSKGFMLRVLFSFDESLAPARETFVPCPAISLYSYAGIEVGAEFLNRSVSEYQPTGSGTVGFYQGTWEDNVPTVGSYTSANHLCDRGGAIPTEAFTASVFHWNDFLYVPTPDNSGTGIIRPLMDGNTLTANSGGSADVQFSLTGPASSVDGGYNPDGAFSIAQQQAQGGILVINAGIQEVDAGDGGPGWPCYVKRMQVWAKDSSVIRTHTSLS